MLNLQAARVSTAKPILRGVDLTRQRGRGARHHGAQRLGQEHARPGAGRAAPATRSPAARCSTTGRTCWRWRRRSGPARASSSPSNIRSRSPACRNTYFLRAAFNAVRKHRGLEELDAMDFLTLLEDKAEAGRAGRGPAQPARQRRLLGRREEAQRDPPDGGARAAPGDPRRDRLRARHRRAARSWPTGSTRCAARDRAIMLVTHYQRLLDYIVPDFVHVLSAGGSSSRATSRSPSNWKRTATRGSKPARPDAPRTRERHGVPGFHRDAA